MKQDAVQLTHFQQAVGRLSGLLLEIMPGLNSQNFQEVVTPIVEQVAEEFPDVDMAEVGNFVERLANVLDSVQGMDPNKVYDAEIFFIPRLPHAPTPKH